MSADDALQGIAAPPMTNGEVLFAEPWQGRVFGMAKSLADAGLYEWDEFRDELIAALGEWQGAETEADGFRYYDHFQRALEAVLQRKGIIEAAEIGALQETLAARPHGHDH